MEVTKNFFDSLDEIDYVIDVDTYELVYASRKALERFGCYSKDKIVGKKCYEVFHNSVRPCNCNSKDQKENSCLKQKCCKHFDKGQAYSMYRLVAENGHKYCLVVAIDGIEQDAFRNFKRKINEAVCFAMEYTTPDGAINHLLEALGQVMNGERAYIYEWDGPDAVVNTYEWTSYGVTSMKESYARYVIEEKWDSWRKYLYDHRGIVLSDIRDVSETTPRLYKFFQERNISSIAVIPMYDFDGEEIGFLGVDNLNKEIVAHAEEVLYMMANYICNIMRNRNLIRKLHEMSYTDQQTKLGNRHAFRKFTEEIAQKRVRSIGVIFTDVTGLKRINDTEGHAAGDRLILKASHIVKDVVSRYKVFRYGGDEFLVICPNTEEIELQQYVEQIKAYAQTENIVLAIGYSFRQISEGNIVVELDRLVSEAETKMYQDKAEYYKRTGIDRWR